MANEYLQRTPTSTGNRRVFTWSGWVKLNNNPGAYLFTASPAKDNNTMLRVTSSGALEVFDRQGSDPTTEQVRYIPLLRDYSSWTHILFNADTTQIDAANRVRAFINGVELSRDATNTLLNNSAAADTPPRNQEFWRLNGAGYAHYIGALLDNTLLTTDKNQLTDVFLVDGQALTPDVFGFYKQGKGYISAGSTQSTDFRPGQWVPKTPRVIKTAINNNGGFGVNGFYLPMNDSNNFGADFHCDPNSIIKLQENLPQPKCRIDGVGDYTGALRDDPFKQYLVLALPFVSSGLSSGFGDYSAAIKGSGSAKTITNSNVSIGNTASYYGSSSYFDGNGDYLRTSTNISDFQFGTGDFTIETWLWKSANGVNSYDGVATLGTNGSAGDGWFLEASATRGYYLVVGGGGIVQYNVSPNTSQWNHLAICRKGIITTMYLNGVAVGINTNSSYTVPATATTLDVGGYAVGSGNYWFNGYLQDLRIYKGVAKYTGGFDVPRPYTPVGIATWRAVPDTTANNFATWNPLYPVITGSNSTYTNGNLTIAEPTGNTSQGTATIGVSTGKWYYEAFPSNVTTGSHLIGIRPAEWFTDNAQNRTAYRSIGEVYNDSGTTVQSGTTYTSSDIIGVAFDMNTKQLWFSKNGSWVYSGNPSGGSNQAVSFASTYTHYTPVFCFDNVAGTQTWDTNFGQNPSFSGNTTAGTYADTNGKGLFKYQPPSGFLALCEDNLPTPAIANPGRHFKTVLYTGDGASGRSITGIGFTPDLVWIKDRNNGAYNHLVSDSVRGSGFALRPSSTNEETASGIRAFNADGFSISSDLGYNVSGNNHVAWCWRAGAGTTSTNTNGSITSVVSANQDAGFSVVSWTGNGSSTATVGHGLGKVPAFLISKARGGTNDWWVVHKSGNGNLQLNNTSALITSGGTNGSMGYPSTLTNSTFTFTNGASSVNNVNQSGVTYISYCWAEIEGFSKAFSYVGNGSADGPMIYLGLKPALIIIKRTDNVGNWQIYDSSRMSTNPNNGVLFPNLSNIEGVGSAYDIDFLSNGFKLRSTDTDRNASGSTYVGFAWAESPFTTSNSK